MFQITPIPGGMHTVTPHLAEAKIHLGINGRLQRMSSVSNLKKFNELICGNFEQEIYN